MRYRLRTLLILAALGPPMLAVLASVLFLGWAWFSGSVPVGDDPAITRLIEDARNAPPVDPLQAKMSPGAWHEYSLMDEDEKAAERRRLGIAAEPTP